MSVNNNQNLQAKERIARFTASGSWVAPAGVYSIRALAVGGGGGGGAALCGFSSNFVSGGGGGGGGVIDDTFPVVPGTTYTVTIGTGGAGANTTTAPGSNGTDTTFGSLFTAPGGQGGVSNNIGTAARPTSNPGGSMGGWGFNTGNSDPITSGHGCGASTPILLASRSSAATLNDIYQPSLFTFFNGFNNITVPVVHSYETGTDGQASILANTDTNTTHYYGVKRTSIVSFMRTHTTYLPGFGWKGLGAGGMSLMANGIGSAIPVNDFNVILEPSAGRVFPDFGAATSSYSKNATDGRANTGAGGGGAIAGGSNATVANGGTGGNGYVEIVWQE